MNDRLQYIQDKQEVILNVRFGIHIGPSGDFSDIQAGMSGMGSKPAVPWYPVYVSVAATPDAPHPAIVLQLSGQKLTSSAVYRQISLKVSYWNNRSLIWVLMPAV
jgi:hypothetical protein